MNKKSKMIDLLNHFMKLQL